MYAQKVDHNFRNIGTVFNQSEARSGGLNGNENENENENEDNSSIGDLKPPKGGLR